MVLVSLVELWSLSLVLSVFLSVDDVLGASDRLMTDGILSEKQGFEPVHCPPALPKLVQQKKKCWLTSRDGINAQAILKKAHNDFP
ncbi:hypothetical protein [Zymomonas mobilis]|nr:hypothetical protein [Zymomonas mobilis]